MGRDVHANVAVRYRAVCRWKKVDGAMGEGATSPDVQQVDRQRDKEGRYGHRRRHYEMPVGR